MKAEKAIEIVKSVRNICGGVTSDALNMAVFALEKQVPMTVTDVHVDVYFCPNCGSENAKDYGSNIGDCYCPNCGQKLEWAQRKGE